MENTTHPATNQPATSKENMMTALDSAIRIARSDVLDGTPKWDAADTAADAFDVDRDAVLAALNDRPAGPRLYKERCQICGLVSWVPSGTDRCECGYLYSPGF